MATLTVTVTKNDQGVLDFIHPVGKTAVELGKDGVIEIKLGTGFTDSAKFDKLLVAQIGNDASSAELDVTVPSPQPVSKTFDDGAVMYLYNNARAEVYIRNDGDDPSTGEDDLEFKVWITDGGEQYRLDPEIRVKSGTAAGTARWDDQSGTAGG